MKILVTGGLVYIGSHTAIELIKAGHEVVILDNLSNCKSSSKVLQGIYEITGVAVPFIYGDVRDSDKMRYIFTNNAIDAVIHFAGVKVASESLIDPIKYYDNNVGGTLTLLETMNKHSRCKKIVFSSTAAVYANPKYCPIPETAELGPVTPYGKSKLMVENMLIDLKKSDPRWDINMLRYFNPIGAHGTGLIGENPKTPPTNIAPVIIEAMTGKRKRVEVFGYNYETRDGTGVRDYIHVVDLALGHLAALQWLHEPRSEVGIFNLGTGYGTTVLELIKHFGEAGNMSVPYRLQIRRPGDLGEVFANPRKAEKEMGWIATLEVGDMCSDAWLWERTGKN